MTIYEKLESNVRSYCRSFPAEFTQARGSELFDTKGKRYLDFFAGAGALNYGHNDPDLRDALVGYVASGGIVHSLDMMTVAKREFLESVRDIMLAPRGLDYKVQFPGPTGTNCVESALKLARKVTRRATVVSFTNGFHGMTMGALSVTGNRRKRAGAGVPLTHSRMLPFDGYLGPDIDTLELFERMLDDTSSGLELPAAAIVETTQAEGGIHVASNEWLVRLAGICKRHGIMLIADDIQVGCGRTGSFFSFERSGVRPDIVCLSKSLSGYGLPFAMMLLSPELDDWTPGEHNGTFRGFNFAFVTARAALQKFWLDDVLTQRVATGENRIRDELKAIAAEFPDGEATVRGIGMIQGIALPEGLARAASARAFELGVMVETAGPNDEVLKLLPALTIPEALLDEGLATLQRAVREARTGHAHTGQASHTQRPHAKSSLEVRS